MHGRRLNSLIKQCSTKQKNLGDDPTLQLAYMDRVLKATATLTNIAEIVLNIKRTLKEVQKVAPVPVFDV